LVRLSRLSLLLAVALALVQAAAVAVAQDASPAPGSAFEGLGLPEFRITVDADAIDAPAEIASGRYLVVLENRSPYLVETTFVLPPAGLTLEQIQATPESGGLPDWVYEATLASGVAAEPGGSAQAVLDLSPAGEWFVQLGRTPDEAAATPPPADFQPEVQVPFTVTAEQAPAVEIPTDLTVGMQEFDFVLPETLPTGPQVWEVTNAGVQPHHLILYRLPGPITDAQVVEALELLFGMRGEDATPSPGLPEWATSEDAFTEVGFVPLLSPGHSAWVPVDLPAATYVAMCFVEDPDSGRWHAVQGMAQVFGVGEGGGTPTA
jgi:hypothetical protein